MIGQTIKKLMLPLLLLLFYVAKATWRASATWQVSHLVMRCGAEDNWLGAPWQLFSYSLVHTSWGHLLPTLILATTIALISRWDWTEYWLLYTAGTLVGGLAFWLVSFGRDVALYGASGGVATLVVATLLFEIRLLIGIHKKIGGLPLIPISVLVLFFLLDLTTYTPTLSAGYVVHLAGYAVGIMAQWLFQNKLAHSTQLYRQEINSIRTNSIIEKAKNSGYSALTQEERKVLENNRQ